MDADRVEDHRVVPLRTVGLLGGMSSQATAVYYRDINRGVQEAIGGHNAAEILLCSVNFENIERFVRNGQWDDAACYLAEKASRIERAGADFLLLATNTLHRVADAIVEAVSVPFVSIFDVTADAVRTRGCARVAMLGTLPVMRDAFYRDEYAKLGVELLSPDEPAQREVDRIIFDELCRDRTLPASKRFILETLSTLRDRGAEGAVLGCTELSMLIGQADLPELPVFDTTALHCRRAVDLCLADTPQARRRDGRRERVARPR